MAWVRIHDAAMSHPKLVGLSDKAFRLWVWGLSYAQQHLTDGAIVTEAIPPRMKRAADDLVQKALWQKQGEGFQIHDYLDWNDSKETILAKRDGARNRLHQHRVKRVSSLTSETPLARSGVGECSEFPEEGAGETTAPARNPSPLPIVDDTIASRAASFVEDYPALYATHRNGARYLTRPALDWDYACNLCRVWDDERLRKLAAVFLSSDDPWIAGGSRTIGQFAARASWCDDRLREWEKSQGVA
jgi:hypothetical protein